MVPPPPEFSLRNQTPILAPPPEFSDARDTHEQATRFNQGHAMQQGQGGVVMDGQHPSQQPFNRQSPMYRSITHSHSSSSSMYSGYPTMSRQQYQLHQQHPQLAHQHMQQYQTQQQQQQQHVQGQLIHAQQQQQQPHPQQAQQQQHIMTMSMPAYQTLGRHQTYSTNNAQSMLNSSAYGHYSTLTNPKLVQSQAQQAQQAQHGAPQQIMHSVQGQPGAPPVPQGSAAVYQQHHPKCYYYQQTSSGSPGQNANAGGKYIPEKLHPVHRYTPGKYC